MFRNTYQKGFLSIFYSIGTEPLAIWRKRVNNGHIKRVTDDDVESIVFEMMGANVATTYIKTPAQAPLKSLAIKLPFLIIIMKNLKKYFSFEVQILDDRNMWRRFRISNYQTTTRVKPFCTHMPIGLAPGWNQIQMNLADFTRRAYGTNYVETVAVQIHANLRLRRVYFSDHLYKEDEKPPEYRLMNPLEKKVEKPKKIITYTRKTQPIEKTIARPTTPQEQPAADDAPAPAPEAPPPDAAPAVAAEAPAPAPEEAASVSPEASPEAPPEATEAPPEAPPPDAPPVAAEGEGPPPAAAEPEVVAQ